jgi:alpha-beta hydrolase superfamily lysophospholipase
MLAPTYAPDADVVGIAAISPASDLQTLVPGVKDTLEGKIISAYLLSAYSAIYRDVAFDRYVRPAARVLVRQAAGRCLELPEAYASAAAILIARQPIYAADPLSGALGRRLAENTPRGSIEAPVLIAQGLSDPLVAPSVQQGFVKERCAAAQRLEYRTYEKRDHLSVLAPESPLTGDLLAWTEARFAGKAQVSGCTTVAR